MPSAINTEILGQLKELLGEDFALILDSFREEGAGMITVMEAASTSGDLNQMKEAAHAMKSMSGNVGAMDLSNTADELQVAAANLASDQVRELWPKLRSEYGLAIEELAVYG